MEAGNDRGGVVEGFSVEDTGQDFFTASFSQRRQAQATTRRNSAIAVGVGVLVLLLFLLWPAGATENDEQDADASKVHGGGDESGTGSDTKPTDPAVPLRSTVNFTLITWNAGLTDDSHQILDRIQNSQEDVVAVCQQEAPSGVNTPPEGWTRVFKKYLKGMTKPLSGKMANLYLTVFLRKRSPVFVSVPKDGGEWLSYSGKGSIWAELDISAPDGCASILTICSHLPTEPSGRDPGLVKVLVDVAKKYNQTANCSDNEKLPHKGCWGALSTVLVTGDLNFRLDSKLQHERWTKIENVHCEKTAIGPPFTSASVADDVRAMADAKAACFANPECQGVYDNYCDGLTLQYASAVAGHRLCSYYQPLEKSAVGSCMWKVDRLKEDRLDDADLRARLREDIQQKRWPHMLGLDTMQNSGLHPSSRAVNFQCNVPEYPPTYKVKVDCQAEDLVDCYLPSTESELPMKGDEISLGWLDRVCWLSNPKVKLVSDKWLYDLRGPSDHVPLEFVFTVDLHDSHC